MADELKIPVTVPGAQQAAQQLKEVAAAEKAVAGAAAESAPGHKAVADAKREASEAAEELTMRDRSLLREIAGLHPVAGAAAEVFNTLNTKTTGLGIAMGLTGAAIGLATLAISEMTKAQEKQKAVMEDQLNTLRSAYDSYLKLSAAIAEKSRPGADVNAATRQAVEIGLAEQLSPEGVKAAGEIIAAGGDMAVALPGLKARYGAKTPELARQYQTEVMGMKTGMGPGAGWDAIIANVAAREGVSSKDLLSNITAALELKRYAGTLAAPTFLSMDDPEGRAAWLQRLRERYPELEQVGFARSPASMWHASYEYAPGRPGGGVLYNIGGTVYTAPNADPAGKPQRRGGS
ncbi:MAG: hypothetical protein ACE15C_14475 [Phycisphaerae bacterium]